MAAARGLPPRSCADGGRLDGFAVAPDGSHGGALNSRAASPSSALRPSSAGHGHNSNIEGRGSPYAQPQRPALRPRPCLSRILGRRAEKADEACDVACHNGKPGGASASSSSRYAVPGPKPDLTHLEELTWSHDLEASLERPGTGSHAAAPKSPRRGKTALDKCFTAEMKRIKQLRHQFPGFSDKLIGNLAVGRMVPGVELGPAGITHLGNAGGQAAPWLPTPCFMTPGPLLPMTAREPVPPGHHAPHSGHAGQTGHIAHSGHHSTPRRPAKPTSSPPGAHGAEQHAEPTSKPAKHLLPSPPSTASGVDNARQRRARVRMGPRHLVRSNSSAKGTPRQDPHLPFYQSEESPGRRSSKDEPSRSKSRTEDWQEEAVSHTSSCLSEAASAEARAFDAVLTERAREQRVLDQAKPDSDKEDSEEDWFKRPKEKRGPTLRRTTDMVMSISRWLRTGITAAPHSGANEQKPDRPQDCESGEISRVASNRSVEAKREPRNLHTLAARHHTPLFYVQEAWQEFSAYNKHPEQGITYEDFLEMLRRRAHLRDGAPIPARLMGHVTLKDLDEHNHLSFETFLEWSISVGWMEEMQVGSYEELEVRRIAREVNMPILDVEKVKSLFDQFDSDHSGMIDEEEFRHIVYKLWRVEDVSDVPIKTLQRIWRQIDQDGSGNIDFQEFLVWYSNFKQFGSRLNMI